MNKVNPFKNLIQNSFRLFGLQLQKYSNPIQQQLLIEKELKQRLQWLIDMDLKTVLDIGANTGQFASSIHKLMPTAMIYSFEPLPDCYESLVANFKDTPNFKAYNIALGKDQGKVTINRNEYTPSSSLLPMADLHKETYPHTQKASDQKVEIARLDDIVLQLKIQEPFLIKLDVQGYEDRVIEGGKKTFNRAKALIIEMSIEELYHGQRLFDDIYLQLRELGFRYRGNYEQSLRNSDGQILHVDSFFTK